MAVYGRTECDTESKRHGKRAVVEGSPTSPFREEGDHARTAFGAADVPANMIRLQVALLAYRHRVHVSGADGVCRNGDKCRGWSTGLPG